MWWRYRFEDLLKNPESVKAKVKMELDLRSPVLK